MIYGETLYANKYSAYKIKMNKIKTSSINETCASRLLLFFKEAGSTQNDTIQNTPRISTKFCNMLDDFRKQGCHSAINNLIVSGGSV